MYEFRRFRAPQIHAPEQPACLSDKSADPFLDIRASIKISNVTKFAQNSYKPLRLHYSLLLATTFAMTLRRCHTRHDVPCPRVKVWILAEKALQDWVQNRTVEECRLDKRRKGEEIALVDEVRWNLTVLASL